MASRGFTPALFAPRGFPIIWRCGSKRQGQYANPVLLLAGAHLTGPAFLNKMLRALEAPGYALAK